MTALIGIVATLAAGIDAGAGDILRGGASAGAAGRRGAANGGGSTDAAVAEARNNARDALARTSQAVQAMRVMQDAARDAARASQPRVQLPNVPNGLAVGALEPDTGLQAPTTTWKNATLGGQSTIDGKTQVTIVQSEPLAVLNWKTFNVGKDTLLKFNQDKGGDNVRQWIAMNKVEDPSGRPSQILGSIEAPGQVYVINRNGIIFGGASQINTHSLTASSLAINENLVNRGLLNNPDAEFLFFTPTVTEPAFTVGAGDSTHLLSQVVTPGSKPKISSTSAGVAVTLVEGVDYELTQGPDKKWAVTFSQAGLDRVSTSPVNVSYYTGLAGDVIVQPGAMLNSPTTPEHVGGRIALFGTNVRNEGTISTPDGQTILAAGRQVGLAAHASSDATLRGLDVFIGHADASSGVATNAGLISAPRANVTIAGKDVHQLGVIDSSTSVSLNGRVDLLASYESLVMQPQDASALFTPSATGSVTLGAGSVIRILPERDSGETAVGTQLALPSLVNIEGRTLRLGENSTILAPGAALPTGANAIVPRGARTPLAAGVTLSAGQWLPNANPSVNGYGFVLNQGQIYLEQGARIDVAGSGDIDVPIARNILSVQLRGAELADSPQQRSSVLRGMVLNVDLRKLGNLNGLDWVGTPLGNVSGFANLLERDAGELTSAGGSVVLRAGDSVVMQPGSVVDVSGGWVNFEGGMIQTTRLISGAQLLDISQATPDRTYSGIYTGSSTFTHSKYGISETYTQPLALLGAHFEQSYVEGRGGGSIQISASSMALDGSLRGATITGPHQLRSTATTSALPNPGALSIAFESQGFSPREGDYPAVSPAPPRIVFATDQSLAPAEPFLVDSDGHAPTLRLDRLASVFLSPELLTQGGFGILSIRNPDGDIEVPAGIKLETEVGGSITLAGANIEIAGNLVAPGGHLSFSAYNISPSVAAELKLQGAVAVLPDASAERGRFLLRSGAALTTAGLIVDDRIGAPLPNSLPLTLNGGSIEIAAYSAVLGSGGILDVSGGVSLGPTGRVSYGNGGSISIQTGQDLSLDAVFGGKLDLGSALLGFSGGKGGALAIRASEVQIGGTPRAGTFYLAPEFFSTGGFTRYAITGLGRPTGEAEQFTPGVEIAPGTLLRPVAQSWLALPHAAEEGGVLLVTQLKPEGQRAAVSLSFSAPNIQDLQSRTAVRGDFILGEGASIQTDAQSDPTGGVSITNTDTVVVLGSISSPGGTIVVQGASKFPRVSLEAAPAPFATVYLGPRSSLSTAGTTLLTPNAFGFRTGTVLAGGSVSVSGNIVAERGAVLDVSGASDVLDFAPAFLSPLDPGAPLVPGNSGLTAVPYVARLVPQVRASDAGTITLKGGEMLYSDATLLGHAGGPAALGGTLIVSSSRFSPDGVVLDRRDPTLQVTQGGSILPAGFYPAGGTPIGRTVPLEDIDATGKTVLGRGHFALTAFTMGGFDSLTLGGNVEFAGRVDIVARRALSVGTGGLIYADRAVSLTAPYVSLGVPFRTPFLPGQENTPFEAVPPGQTASTFFYFSPTYGTGELKVTADLIDVGFLSLQKIGRASLIAAGGDIRGNGTLNIAGELSLQAAQIYPTTASTFTLVAYDDVAGDGTVLHEGRITISASGSRALPLSAGGTLNIFASQIEQNGVLRAPLGSINLGWDGSGSSPVDLITGAGLPATDPAQPLQRSAVPITKHLVLGSGSVTSVSGIDPATGAPMLIPYGLSTNGTTWIDPRGVDITAGGLPAKTIHLLGQTISAQAGSLVDIGGGGDLLAYRWVQGQGGSRDLLASTGSFAVLPGYDADYAPIAPFNASGASAPAFTVFNSATGLNVVDPGYVNNRLVVGDKVFLGASEGLAEGVYTLLPARYALLPGAVLITPASGTPMGTVAMPDGSSIVSGYRFNGLNPVQQPLFARFEVAPAAVLAGRAQYDMFSANTFLRDSAVANNLPVPRLPIDSGYLLLQATQGISLLGAVHAQAPTGARAGLIDISSQADFLIIGGAQTGAPGPIVLDAGLLSSFGAESLLIGGRRQFTTEGATVVVTSGHVTVDNAGTPLSGPEIILVANGQVVLAPGAQVVQTGSLVGDATALTLRGSAELTDENRSLAFSRGGTPIKLPQGTSGTSRVSTTVAATITFADGSTQALAAGSAISIPAGASITLSAAGSLQMSGTGSVSLSLGDGALLRVSSDPAARSLRENVAGLTSASVSVGAGARIEGASVTVDSTFGTMLSPLAVLEGSSINLGSGQITLVLENPGAVASSPGLVLTGPALAGLQESPNLSLLSYSTLDIYGQGVVQTPGSLALHAAQIRGFHTGAGVTLSAGHILLDNSAGGFATAAVVLPTPGTELILAAESITLGANQVNIDQFDTVTLRTPSRLLLGATGGLQTHGNLIAETGLVQAASGVNYSLTALGNLTVNRPAGSSTVQLGEAGDGASLTLTGSSVSVTSDVRLPSGSLVLHATGATGDVTVGGLLDVGGHSQAFFDLIKYTDGGEIHMASDHGNVTLLDGGVLNVSAAPGGGNAGILSVTVPEGAFSVVGELRGSGGAGGQDGSFSLDVGILTSNAPLAQALDDGAFFEARNYRVRLGDVTLADDVRARHFRASADHGSIVVSGKIDASGDTGGTIDLLAFGSVTLENGAVLDASGAHFSSAGKGGAVSLEAGAYSLGEAADPTAMVDLQAGSTIDLSVAAVNGPGATLSVEAAAQLGQFTGTLHLRAPQTAGGQDLQIAAIGGAVINASNILLEGYHVFDLTGSGAISTAVQNSVRANGTLFAGNTTAIANRIFGGAAPANVVIAPGAEIINTNGNLTLGQQNGVSDWDLSSFRFGPKLAPGVLTLRASGDLVFLGSLSDGFTPVSATVANGNSTLWLATLQQQKDGLPANLQSWSYRLTSGADFSAADFRQVTPLLILPSESGSLKLGKFAPQRPAGQTPSSATTAAAIGQGLFQVIRTGTGNIDISSARDVQLLNQFATIYTAGVQVKNPGTLFTDSDFALPVLTRSVGGAVPQGSAAGNAQQVYPAQYALGGGNVTIEAQADIKHLTSLNGRILEDSVRELPNNWLYRRGYVDPATGLFGASGTALTGSPVNQANDPTASTTWWINYSNFFQGVGALGGGDVTLVAGQDVRNVDAVIPTNARMAGRIKTTAGDGSITFTNIAPDAGNLVQLGGGDLRVEAGRNIDGGIYYVERGRGALTAGHEITTNATRSPSLTNLESIQTILAPQTWLPTTLFAGDARFDVNARGNVLLGPTANTFLLPQGYTNLYYYKTYFSTYTPTAEVNVSSLGGDVTLREAATLPSEAGDRSILEIWMQNELLYSSSGATAASYLPWLRLTETLVSPFGTVAGIQPPTLRITAFSGDINLVGDINLSPSARGTLEVATAGSLNGLQPTGISTGNVVWNPSQVNLSDADPLSIPSASNPFAFQELVGRGVPAQTTGSISGGGNSVAPESILATINNLFAETGSFQGASGSIEVKQALHAPSLLHAGDPSPLYLYASGGDISGLTLFSSKAARVSAERDLTDISFYLQNVNDDDISVISAGRDIIAYNASTPLRTAAQSPGNVLVAFPPSAGAGVNAGDLQISGPGTLEVLAGRNLDLGIGGARADGTGVGITSVGNARNISLPFEGARLVIGAGLGQASSLSNSDLDFATFIERFSQGGGVVGVSGGTLPPANDPLGDSPEAQALDALDVFYQVLRDAGRNFPTTGNYASGFDAIALLFPQIGQMGDITTRGRDIRTKNGGSIEILAPGGKLTLADTVIGNPPVPPGIVTESGGDISIFTDGNVDIGIGRIFTLRGGNQIIWSSTGNIAAGTSSKTVQSAPPTRVVIDTQSADVNTDLAGLATGGGIGVLATTAGVKPGDVDLIAPTGVVDAGDAGIRAGNLNISALQVLNADNIAVSGTSAGIPTAPPVVSPNLSGLAAASSATAGANSAAEETAKKAQEQAEPADETPSTITVEVIGYGGGGGDVAAP